MTKTLNQGTVSKEVARLIFGERNLRIRKLHKDGYTLREIGKEFGISHQRVDQIVKGGDTK